MKNKALKLVAAIVLAIPFVIGSATPANAADIVCVATANYPHGSVHVGGTVNATGSVNCPIPVASIYIWLKLQRYGTSSYSTNWAQNFGKSYLSTNAAMTCQPAYYFLTMSVTVTFPPGVTPATRNTTRISPIVYVACNGTARAGASVAPETLIQWEIPS